MIRFSNEADGEIILSAWYNLNYVVIHSLNAEVEFNDIKLPVFSKRVLPKACRMIVSILLAAKPFSYAQLNAGTDDEQ
jgi:hypothetical protein